MPADFDKCVSSGGRVRTIRHAGDKYQHICFKGGKSYAGHVKTNQRSKVVREAAKKGRHTDGAM